MQKIDQLDASHRGSAGVQAGWRWALLAALMMGLAVGVAHFLTPRNYWADTQAPLNLPTVIPAEFGSWRLDPDVQPVLPDPTVEAQLQSLYSATLNRTYRRADGASIMLSVAYGRNQNSESTAAHRPEFCYAGQGFIVQRAGVERIRVQNHGLDVVQLMAVAGLRHEPITYWVTLGDRASIPGLSRKLAQMRFGLQGWIMDGMLMRVSSLTPTVSSQDQQAARNLHTQFINELAAAVEPAQRARLFGSNRD